MTDQYPTLPDWPVADLHADGRLDESLRRDLTWAAKLEQIYQWERGENFGPELVEISAGEAEALMERFRQKWAQ